MNAPLRPKHRPYAPWHDRQTSEATGRSLIVVAEDDHEMRSLLVTALRRDNYEVIEARDGRELLKLLNCDRQRAHDGPAIDLVISDIRMPGRTGLDVLATLRLSDWATPFILTTAFGDPQTHAEARRLGAVAVFDKPFDIDDLRTIVCNLVA